MTKTKIQPLQERRVNLAGATRDDETRTVRAALSTETAVNRLFGAEVLEHSDDAIDLSRANGNGLPLLVNHDDTAPPIGRVRDIRLDDDRVLRADMVFSEATQAARDAWDLVRDGTLSDVSIRYRINSYDVEGAGSDDEIVRVTDWTLIEGSVVSVPADPSAGIGRQLTLEGIDMPEQTTPAPAPVPEKTKTKPAANASRRAGQSEGVRIERERQDTIRSIGENFAGTPAVDDLVRDALADGTPVEDFKEALIVALAPDGHNQRSVAVPVPQPELSRRVAPSQPGVGSTFAPGEDGNEKLARGLAEALEIRIGLVTDRDVIGRNEYTSRSLLDMARICLESRGMSTAGMSKEDVAGQALVRFIEPGTANLTTGSFTSILENTMNKALFAGFDEAPVTWNLWCGVDSAQDFKQASRPGVSQFTSLTTVAENAAIQDGILTDKHENFQIETYSRKFSVTRQVIVNDDLGGLNDAATKMGRAAARTVDEQVYAYLEANPTMNEDGNPLFDLTTRTGTDINEIAGAGPPSTDNVGQARVSMGKKTDHNAVVLGIVPQYMVCPIELEQEMLEISTLNADPQRVRRDNVYAQMWQPVATPRLSDATDWYMFGNRGDCINVAFLNGMQTPMMARDEGWSVLSAHWRVVLDFTVYAIDYRAGLKFSNA